MRAEPSLRPSRDRPPAETSSRPMVEVAPAVRRPNRPGRSGRPRVLAAVPPPRAGHASGLRPHPATRNAVTPGAPQRGAHLDLHLNDFH